MGVCNPPAGKATKTANRARVLLASNQPSPSHLCTQAGRDGLYGVAVVCFPFFVPLPWLGGRRGGGKANVYFFFGMFEQRSWKNAGQEGVGCDGKTRGLEYTWLHILHGVDVPG